MGTRVMADQPGTGPLGSSGAEPSPAGPHEVSVHRRVAAAPQAVWETITDLDGAAEILSQVTELRLLTSGPYAVGTGWRETRRIMGRTETQELWVVENDPGRRTVTEADDRGTRYRTEIILEPLDAGAATLLTVGFSARTADPTRLQRLALKVMGPLGVKLTERSLRTELDDIARAAEHRAR